MLRKIKNRIIAISVSVFIASLMATSGAQAITLIPPSLELGLTPGQTQNTVIKLFNETPDTVELFTETRNFTAKGDTGQPAFDFDSEPFGISTWVEIEPGPIILAPGERYEVPFSINPPINADPGGHYAAVFFTTAPPESGQVRVASKIGTLILASVDGEILELGIISEFSTKSGKTWFNRLPVEFTSRFQNTGNVHLKPVGTVTITNLFGSTSDVLDYNAAKGATLPKTIRKYEVMWEKGNVIEKPGNLWSDFWQEYGNERKNFAFGKYTAVLDITAGTGDVVTDSKSISFWVFPWHVVLVWLVIILLAIFILIMAIKKYNAWIITKARK